jgi:hypothetical protein
MYIENIFVIDQYSVILGRAWFLYPFLLVFASDGRSCYLFIEIYGIQRYVVNPLFFPHDEVDLLE